MSLFWVMLLIITGIILVIFFIHYILTLPKRRKNKEIIRREALLYRENLQAERAKQIARVIGKNARDNIEKLARK